MSISIEERVFSLHEDRNYSRGFKLIFIKSAWWLPLKGATKRSTDDSVNRLTGFVLRRRFAVCTAVNQEVGTEQHSQCTPRLCNWLHLRANSTVVHFRTTWEKTLSGLVYNDKVGTGLPGRGKKGKISAGGNWNNPCAGRSAVHCTVRQQRVMRRQQDVRGES